MKLIIDISEEAKRRIDTFKGKFLCGDGFDLIEAIKNGIPLDNVKAEIEKNCDRINSIASVLSYPQHREIQELLCEILASIGKAESEVKPNE